MKNKLLIRAAFSVWENRIAPVFDVARQIHLIEADEGMILMENQGEFDDDAPSRRARQLSELNVTTLVCGAISRPMHELVAAQGIYVIPFVTGTLSEVVKAWIGDKLDTRHFTMPGCRRRGSRRNCKLFIDMEDLNMNGINRGGMGQGSGRGRGRGGRGMGRMGGPRAAGPQGYCVCPKCGYSQPHQRGVPCMQIQCPTCGIAMARS